VEAIQAGRGIQQERPGRTREGAHRRGEKGSLQISSPYLRPTASSCSRRAGRPAQAGSTPRRTARIPPARSDEQPPGPVCPRWCTCGECLSAERRTSGSAGTTRPPTRSRTSLQDVEEPRPSDGGRAEAAPPVAASDLDGGARAVRFVAAQFSVTRSPSTERTRFAGLKVLRARLVFRMPSSSPKRCTFRRRESKGD